VNTRAPFAAAPRLFAGSVRLVVPPPALIVVQPIEPSESWMPMLSAFAPIAEASVTAVAEALFAAASVVLE
jgi:hypothetical protein